MSLRQKVYRLEKKVEGNRGELKFNQDYLDDFTLGGGSAQIIELTQIGQGAGNTQRNGNDIKVEGFNLRCYAASTRVLMAVVIAPHGTLADSATYPLGRGAHIDELKDEDFKELCFLRNYQSTTQHCEINKKFRVPVHTEYSSSSATSGVKNRIFLIFKNLDGLVQHTCAYSFKLYFRDD